MSNTLWEHATDSYLEVYAKAYQGALFTKSDPAGGNASDYSWRFHPTYPLHFFLHEKESKKQWIAWLQEEIKMWEEEGQPDRFQDLLTEDIYDPIIAVHLGKKAYLWDGTHRVACSISRELPYVPAIVGTRKFNLGCENQASPSIY